MKSVKDQNAYIQLFVEAGETYPSAKPKAINAVSVGLMDIPAILPLKFIVLRGPFYLTNFAAMVLQ